MTSRRQHHDRHALERWIRMMMVSCAAACVPILATACWDAGDTGDAGLESDAAKTSGDAVRNPGTDGSTGDRTCTSHADCPLGTVCTDNNRCEKAPCEFCEGIDDLICYDPPDAGVPSCSRPPDGSDAG